MQFMRSIWPKLQVSDYSEQKFYATQYIYATISDKKHNLYKNTSYIPNTLGKKKAKM